MFLGSDTIFSSNKALNPASTWQIRTYQYNDETNRSATQYAGKNLNSMTNQSAQRLELCYVYWYIKDQAAKNPCLHLILLIQKIQVYIESRALNLDYMANHLLVAEPSVATQPRWIILRWPLNKL
jgi:hypothetical protein